MYLSPRFTSDSLRGLKRHITLMLHSAGSAIFLGAGAGGREPLPAARSGRKQALAEGLGSRKSRESVPGVALCPEGAEEDGDWKRRRRQPRPEAHFRSIMAAVAVAVAAAAPGGASTAHLLSFPLTSLDRLQVLGVQESGPLLPWREQNGPPPPRSAVCLTADPSHF